MAAKPDPELSITERMARMIGSDERCMYCGHWVPQVPVEGWVIVVGPDHIGVAHNYRNQMCLVRDHSNWEVNTDAQQ